VVTGTATTGTTGTTGTTTTGEATTGSTEKKDTVTAAQAADEAKWLAFVAENFFKGADQAEARKKFEKDWATYDHATKKEVYEEYVRQAEALKKKGGKDDKEAMVPAPATILVSLPADAKVTIDGAPTASTSAVRRFVSPTLQPGQEYTYSLTAEVVREGQTVSTTQQVAVRAGRLTTVHVELPAAVAVASN
jgi:uncharacterized protein (TIGR03000 family)